MAHPAPLVALLTLAVFTAGCLGPTPSHVSDWKAEARAHGPTGLAAEMDLRSNEFGVVGKGQVPTLEAPLQIQPSETHSRAGPVTFFVGTVLGAGSGLIVLESARLNLSAGQISKLPVERVQAIDGEVLLSLHDADVTDRPHITFPPTHSELDSAWFFSDHVPIQGRDLVVDEAEHALLIDQGNATPLTFPIHFDADHLALDRDGRIRTTDVTFRCPTFAYAGKTEGGSVDLDGHTDLVAPDGVFGNDVDLQVTPTGIASTRPFRLTQALTEDGYALDASVELRPHQERVPVDAGNVSWVRVDYREKGYTGAAVLQNITIDGPAAALVRVPLDHPPWIVEELWEFVGETGWSAPFWALPVAIASPWLILGEALLKGFDCVFNDCPADHPYPRWIEPGHVGRFYYQVDAVDAEPGTYPGTITILGENHKTVTLDVVVEVR